MRPSGAERKKRKAAAARAAGGATGSAAPRLGERPAEPSRFSAQLRLNPKARPSTLECDFCFGNFVRDSAWTPKGAPSRPPSAARPVLQLCSGCAPVQQLISRLRRSGPYITEDTWLIGDIVNDLQSAGADRASVRASAVTRLLDRIQARAVSG